MFSLGGDLFFCISWFPLHQACSRLALEFLDIIRIESLLRALYFARCHFSYQEVHVLLLDLIDTSTYVGVPRINLSFAHRQAFGWYFSRRWKYMAQTIEVDSLTKLPTDEEGETKDEGEGRKSSESDQRSSSEKSA